VCRSRGEHLFFAVDEITGAEGGDFESMPVGDGIRRTGFYAISAENAAVVIDVVDLGIALGAAYAILFGIFRGFDVDAV